MGGVLARTVAGLAGLVEVAGMAGVAGVAGVAEAVCRVHPQGRQG